MADQQKSYMIYLTAPYSVTLIHPYPQFQGHAILTLTISETVRHTDIASLKYYATMTLSDLAKFSITRSHGSVTSVVRATRQVIWRR